MNSDSESQDSDDGRRFRFETTRKDTNSTVPIRRDESPQRKRHRSRSRDRSRLEYSSRRSRSPKERHSSKSSRKKHHKDKDSHRSKDSRDSDSSGTKHKNKHKRRSRDKSIPESKVEEKKKTDVEEKKKPDVEEKKIPEIVKMKTKIISAEDDEEACRALDIAQAAARKKPKSFFDRVVNKESCEADDYSYYGPSLPPSIEKKMLNAGETEKVIPIAPEVIGPALPPSIEEEISNPIEEKSDEDEEMEEDPFGPSLPPNLQEKKILGPTLPANFVIPNTDIAGSEKSEEDLKVDNKDMDEDDDDTGVFGPLPPDHPAARDSNVQMQLEYRALQVKARFNEKTTTEKNKREEWMTELPPAHAVALGLGSINRKFKTSEGPDMSDRSMWTDTPADRLKKQKEKEENRFIPSEETEKKKSKNKKERKDEAEEEKQESLLDMHLKTLKKKKKKLEKEAKELGLSTRRPFDRDVDLQANRLDEARKKKIFQKASRLNDRFTVGNI